MTKTIKNVILNISYQVLNIIIPLITAPYIARIMKPSGVGIYSYSSSVASYFALFMLLGISNYGSRTIAVNIKYGKEVISKRFWEMYILQIFSSAVCMFIFIGFTVLFGGLYKAALLAQILYLISVALDISWYFVGTEQFKITVTRSFLIKVLQTIAIFAFVKSSDDLILYIVIISMGALLGSLALWIIVAKQIAIKKVTFKGIIAHFKPNLVLFITLLASSVFVYMDKIMLGIISSSVNLGLYEYSEKIVRLPLTVISAIGVVMMPKISILTSQKESGKTNQYMDASMRYVSLLSSAMTFGIIAIANDLAIVYLGEEFSGCGSLMKLMSVIILISSFANIIRTQYLMPNEMDNVYALSIVAGAIVNLLLNSIFIPGLGSTGAVIGTVGAEFAVFIGHIIGVFRKLNLKKYLSEWFSASVCGFLMLLTVKFISLFINNQSIRVIAGILIGSISFFVYAVLSLLLRKDRIITDFIGRFKK